MRAFQDMLLGPLKSLLMRALQQQLSKYIHNIELEALGIGGDIVLENLEIRKDVLHESLRIPTDYDISRGFIKELRIQIPWTRLQSRPIDIKFKTVEIIITPITHTKVSQHEPSPIWRQKKRGHSRQPRSGEEQTSAAGSTGWMQQLLTKVLANMSVSVSNLVLKYEDADVVLSAALKSLDCFSANPDQDWTPAFAALDDSFGLLHKLVRASDLTVCLDRYCAPDPTRPRQVQAFEVPILDRASFEVRLLACVWLVAPGPPESSLASWEDQQEQMHWQDGEDSSGIGMPPSPGAFSVRRGGRTGGAGAGGSPKTPATTPRVSVLGRLVGGDRRAGGGINRAYTDGVDSAVAAEERDLDELPVLCVCPLLQGGWSRRASSAYSPFFDERGAWSPSEATAASTRDEDRVGGSTSGDSEGEEGGGFGEGCRMPVPTAVADLLIDELSFSLSNQQVRLMKELIDRAMEHVASNASRNKSAQPSVLERPTAPMPKISEPVPSRWWPFYWGGSVPEEEKENLSNHGLDNGAYAGGDVDEGRRGSASQAFAEGRSRDAYFVVASSSIGSVSLRLLEHQARHEDKDREGKAEEDDEAAMDDDEPESISVPVHGLGTVSVSSVPVGTRKPSLRPPVAFAIVEVKGLTLDVHLVPGISDLVADVKVELSAVVARHAPLQNSAAPTDHSSSATPTSATKVPLDDMEPFFSWGGAVDLTTRPETTLSAPSVTPESSDTGGGDSEGPGDALSTSATNPRSAPKVRRCLIEHARRLPRLPADHDLGDIEASPVDEDDGLRRRGPSVGQALATPAPPSTPKPITPVPSQYTPTQNPTSETYAMQYRLLKHKSSAPSPAEGTPRGGGVDRNDSASGSSPGSIAATLSALTECHDISLGALQVHVDEGLLTSLLKFAGVQRGREQSSASPASGDPLGAEERGRGNIGLPAATQASFFMADDARIEERHDQAWLSSRFSPRAAVDTDASRPSARLSTQASATPPCIATSDKSLHVSLRAVAVALDLTATHESHDVDDNVLSGRHSSPGVASETFLVLSLPQLEISGSESLSSAIGADHVARLATVVIPDGVRQRVCSLSLKFLSIVAVDGSALALSPQALPTVAPWSPSTAISQSFVQKLFVAAGADTTSAGTRSLARFHGIRVTAEVLSTAAVETQTLPAEREAATTETAASTSGDSSEILFNASCERFDACTSSGAVLVALKCYFLYQKMSQELLLPLAGHGGSFGTRHWGQDEATVSRWKRGWHRGVGVSLQGIGAGGAVKNGSVQLTGNVHRLSVGLLTRDDAGLPRSRELITDAANVALFEARSGDEGREGLSWSTTTFDAGHGRRIGIKLASDFQSAVLHYVNGQKVYRELKSLVKEWEEGVSLLCFLGRGIPAGEGAQGSAAEGKMPTTPVEFDFRGMAVTLRLPFDLCVEVKRVNVSGRPVHGRLSSSPVRHDSVGRDDGSLDITLSAGDVWIFHAPYGRNPYSPPRDARPAAIRCSAQGVVTTRPRENAVCVSLETEHVRVRLTPAFCSSFGSFIRFMVGPPARPRTSFDADGSVALLRVPEKFTFELKVGTADVDFFTGPCSPWAVSANIVVGAVFMRHRVTGAITPEAGTAASFEMGFKTLQGTQRRDPRRSAPAFPEDVAQLIGDFLGPAPGGGNVSDDASGGVGGREGGRDQFFAWLSARNEPERREDEVETLYKQMFIMSAEKNSNGTGDVAAATTQAFSVVTRSSGPRHRVVNRLELRLAPVLVACYPPTFRLLVGHYNRFGGNAFRPFRSRSSLPKRRIAVVLYDVDIRGCSAVLLASLADGARGIHLSAGVVSVKESTSSTAISAAAAMVTSVGRDQSGNPQLSSSGGMDAHTALTMTGFVGPVGLGFVEDWRTLMPASGTCGKTGISTSGVLPTGATTTPLCVPIDLRWTVSYDKGDECRQDVSLSSVQLYLEQPHFDLCARLAQIVLSADYPGALPPKSRHRPSNLPRSKSTTAGSVDANGVNRGRTSVDLNGNAVLPATAAAAESSSSRVEAFLPISLRLPLFQVVLAMGKRNDPSPPVLEIDVASVRLAQGGVFTVRHVSINGWSQGNDGISSLRRTASGTRSTGEDGAGGRGFRVLGRTGQSEEAGKDFMRMDLRVPEIRTVRGILHNALQPQIDIVVEVEPFSVYVNPGILRSLTAYMTPIPFAVDSAEEKEVPFPQRPLPTAPACPNGKDTPTTASAVRSDDLPGVDDGDRRRRSSVGDRVSTDFEKSAMSASASVKILASQISLELSSYPGGPAFVAGASHLFVRAIMWPVDDAASRQGQGDGSPVEGSDRARNGKELHSGPEVFARLSRISCRVNCGDLPAPTPASAFPSSTVAAAAPISAVHNPTPQAMGVVTSRTDEPGDAVLKPFDVDIHLTCPRGGSGSNRRSAMNAANDMTAARGWHTGVYVDEVHLKFGAAHVRSLELLIDLFLPAVAAAQATTAALARARHPHGTTSGVQGPSVGRVNDLHALERIECAVYPGDKTALKPEPGQMVFFGIEKPQGGRREGGETDDDEEKEDVAGMNVKASEGEKPVDGWINCCEWSYWGLRRVAQIALPSASLRCGIVLVEDLFIDALEVELSFLDVLTGTFKAATRFNVPCQGSTESPSQIFTDRPRATVEPSQPFLARKWRLAWRIPTWLKVHTSPSMPVTAGITPSATTAWSSTLVRALSICSTPASPVVGPSSLSTTLVAQRFALALLTDSGGGGPVGSAPPLWSPSSPRSGARGRRDDGLVQSEEIVRLVADDVNFFAETGMAGGLLAAAIRGSAVMAVEVQDFSNFLRLPVLSHALVKLDVAISSGGESFGDGHLLSPFRPVASAAVEIHDGVVSASVTAMQCIDRCIREMSRRSTVESFGPAMSVHPKPPRSSTRTNTTCNLFPEEASKVLAPERLVPPLPPPLTSSIRQPSQRTKRYVLTNLTDRALWFGQASTTETLLLRPGHETSYRWRTIPSAGARSAAGHGKKDDNSSRLVLMLRLALYGESKGNGSRFRAVRQGRLEGGIATWAEPFPTDQAGKFMRLLRSAGPDAGPTFTGGSQERGDAIALPLWVVVTKEGLQTRIELHGEWIFTNHLLHEVQVSWATPAGVGSSSRSLVEPAGTRGSLNLPACGSDESSDGSEDGEEARVPRPPSCSVLAAFPPRHGVQGQHGKRLPSSELMLEFRLACPDESAVVGSVGPPPNGADATAAALPESDARRQLEGNESEDEFVGSWAVTRQSEWVEARPLVYVSLISCASPDARSSGFWFWCVASRQPSPLSEICEGCSLASFSSSMLRSREVGMTEHHCHPGQMRVDLRPVAMVWNRCSQPLRVMLHSTAIGGGHNRSGHTWWRGEGKSMEKDLDESDADTGAKPAADFEATAVKRPSAPRCSAFLPSGSKAAIQSGGRTAVCLQPFVDYDLALMSAPSSVGAGAPLGRENRECSPSSVSSRPKHPFLVSVPSELLSQSCEATWLPLHSRALTENVLCPVVIVASRELGALWPSLSLRVYPGLSIHNCLPVPLSLRAVFAQPTLGTVSGVPASHPPEADRALPVTGARQHRRQDEGGDGAAMAPLLPQEPLVGELAPSSASGDDCGKSSDQGFGNGGGVTLVRRVLRVPAERRYSAWEIFDSESYPVPLLLPAVSMDFGLCAEDEQVDDPVSACRAAADRGGKAGGVERIDSVEGGIDAGLAPDDAGTSRSREVKVSLDGTLSELVLIPWGADGSAVLPAFVTLERESVLGGVELIRLGVYPRVVVHNATGVPISLSLLSRGSDAARQPPSDDMNDSSPADREGSGPTLPMCRVHLTAEGRDSSMNLLALAEKRISLGASSTQSCDTQPTARETDKLVSSERSNSNDAPPSRSVGRTLSWLLGFTKKPDAPPKPAGFSADLELAFGWDGLEAENSTSTRSSPPYDSPPCNDGTPTVQIPYDRKAVTDMGERGGATPPARPTFNPSAIISLLESPGGASLQCEPSFVTVPADGGRRAARVCVAMGEEAFRKGDKTSPTGSPSSLPSPTRHILLYQDPQPGLTICNRSAAPVTVVVDCGTTIEVPPGGTAEHSWQEAGRKHHSIGDGLGGVGPVNTAAARLSPSWPSPDGHRDNRERRRPDHRSRGYSEGSTDSMLSSATPGSPAAKNLSGSRDGSSRNRAGRVMRGPGCASAAPSKPRPHRSKLGGDATLQHWFRCKGGSRESRLLPWSDPLWVAQGVQVIRFDRQEMVEEDGSGGGADDHGGGDEAGEHGHNPSGFVGGNETEEHGFGAGATVREVQVHVAERAGGFVMTFAEGGIGGAATDGHRSTTAGMGDASGQTATESRGVLRRWAAMVEQHVVLTILQTTIQLLDDSNFHTVVKARQDGKASGVGMGARGTAASVTADRQVSMDGWIGGIREGPGGLQPDRSAAHLPAAAIPAILSVFIDASSARVWRAAPAVRTGMSTLDLERCWYLKDRIGVDVSLTTLEVNNHVADHRLPVLFCFRKGGRLVDNVEAGRSEAYNEATQSSRFTLSLTFAETWEDSRVPAYLEKISVRSAPIDVCLEDSLLPPLLEFLERAGLVGGLADGSKPFAVPSSGSKPSASDMPGIVNGRPQLPAHLAAAMAPRLFIQHVDIGGLVVRATVQGYIPGKQVFLALNKSPLLFRPVSLRGVLARPEEIAEQIASNYAADAMLRSLAVVGSLEALGSPTTLISEWGKGVYDLFAMPIQAIPQGPSSTVRATLRGFSSLVRHASVGTLSSVSGVTNALSRNLGTRGRVARPIAGTMGLVHRTSRSLIASTGVDSEWVHAKAATAANPAVAYLNADLWYRWCLLPPGHEFLYRTPALCSNASYSQVNVPVTIVLSSKAVFLYRGGSGCEKLWKQIEHQDITLVEQSAEHAPAELILNARAYSRPRRAVFSSSTPSTVGSSSAAAFTTDDRTGLPSTGEGREVGGATATAAVVSRPSRSETSADDSGVPDDGSAAPLEAEKMEFGGLLMKLSLPNSPCCRELAQLLHGLSDKAWRRR